MNLSISTQYTWHIVIYISKQVKTMLSSLKTSCMNYQELFTHSDINLQCYGWVSFSGAQLSQVSYLGCKTVYITI